MPSRPRLTPARPDTPEAASYRPRFPLRWIILAITLTTTVTVGFRIKERGKAAALRQQILSVHEQELGPAKERYQAFRQRVEALVHEAAADDPPAPYVHPQLKLAGLRSGKGLYLRIPRAAGGDPGQLASAATRMEQDALVRCLGLTAASARGLYEQGGFLSDEWAEETRQEEGVMELRVRDEMLAQHIERDLPSILSLLKSQWLLLVLQGEEARGEGPVDVYLWDLSADTKLLSARIQPRGIYLRARIAGKDARPHLAKEGGALAAGSAQDCSIAAQLQALQGAKLTEVHSDPQAAPTPGQAHPTPPSANDPEP